MNAAEEKVYRRLLHEMCEDCPDDKWCLIREYAIHTHPSRKFWYQIQCMAIFKLDLGKEFKKKVEWDESNNLWVERGYAKVFSELYNEKIKVVPLYDKIKEKIANNG